MSALKLGWKRYQPLVRRHCQ